MSCCGDPLIPAPPPPPPPPPGADGCLKTVWECECPAGVSQWGLLSHDCIPNADCTGQLSCTDLSCVIELFNGCVVGDPPPAPLVPFCAPHCCPDATTTTTTTTTPPPTTTTTTPPPTTTTTTTPPPAGYCNCVYQSTYDCGTLTWSGPTLVSACTDDLVDASSAWAVTIGCDAETTVSAAGPCDLPM